MSVRTVAPVGLLVGISLLFVLAGCATSSSASRGGGMPAWYLDPASVYPDQTYLAAVGSGGSRRAAEEQAFASLASIFEVDIAVSQEIQERYQEIVSPGGTFSDEEILFTQTTNLRAAQRLLNVQLGEAAVDNLGRVYIIAYLERMPTGRIYQDLIEKNGRQISTLLNRADDTNDLIRRYALTSAAAVIATSNEVLIQQLRIIAPMLSQVTMLNYDYAAIQDQLVELSNEMRTVVTIANDPGQRVEALVREGLTAERFPISETDPVLFISGSLSLEPIQLNRDFESVRWVLTLAMASADGRELVRVNQQGRSSGITEEAAISAAYRDVGDLIRRGFIGEMRRYLDRLVTG